MNYRVKITKNDEEICTDKLHITDTIPSVLNGKYPKFLMPLTNTFMGGCLAYADTIDKRNDNTFPFIFNKIGGGVWNSNGFYQLTGIEGNIKSLGFSYKDAVEHYMETNYLRDGFIQLGYDTAQYPYLLDYENGYLYTLTNTSWQASDMTLRKYKLPVPEITLNNGRWSYDYISYVNLDSLCELKDITVVPHAYFSDNYGAGGLNFAELDGYDPTIYNSDATSVTNYGSFNSHSVTFNEKYIIAMDYFRYNNIVISSGSVIDSHSFSEFCLIDKKTWEIIPFFLDEFGGDSQYRLCCADDEYVYIANGENSPKDIHRLSISALIEYAQNNSKATDKLGIERYITTADLEYVQSYDASFCHIINVKNKLSWGSLDGYTNEELGMQIYKGTNGFTGIFKQAIAAIANVDITVTSSDVLKIYLEEDSE